jgi:regulator of sirC expression with transglutaminase-like and TPR domain
MSDVASADRELEALVSLLETEREPTLGILMEQIRSFPDSRFERLLHLVPAASRALPQLDLVTAERAVPRMQAALLEWRSSGADLENGMTLLARTAYPRLNADDVGAQLDDLANQIRGALQTSAPRNTLATFTQQMRELHGFHGSSEDYYDPDKTYINRVLEYRTGLPISLSAVYMLIGKRLGLDIDGVALPGHFIACFRTGSDTLYFDPFRDGVLLSLREVMSIVTGTGTAFRPEHLRPPTAPEILRRMLSNLEAAYGRRHDSERSELVRQYLSVLS